ncbi:MAG: amidohydrolase [Bacillota bacterium]|nr:amidohydrolase [Bacillota bacterium]
MKRLFINGKIFTSDRARLYADAMLVDDGRIQWTCSRQELHTLLSKLSVSAEDMRVTDLQGHTVIPGFVGAHMHPMMLAEYSRQIACLPPNVNSIEELVGAIAKARAAVDPIDLHTANSSGAAVWIRGWGYDENKYPERRSPNRYDLDRGCSDLPVFLVRSCEHVRCVNSKALEIAGITKDTPDPPGGVIDRDENGEPTGVLRENARDLILPYMPEETQESMVDALVDLGNLLTSQGIVAIGDMGNLHPGGNYEYFAKAQERGFRQRVSMYYMWDYFMDDPERIPYSLMDQNARLRFAGLKLIGDGSFSGRTAWLTEPYLNSDVYGMPVYSDESLERAIDFARKTGCQISVHAMGGRAIDRIIDRIYEESDWTDGSIQYLRVEHVTEPSAGALEKASERGFAFVSQPIFGYCEIETYLKNIGHDRLKTLYPYRRMLDAGIDLCLSTDAPATSWAVPSDPFSNLKSAVTRKAYDGTDIGQDEKLDIETAVILYTKASARACGFAGLGQLSEGCSADFVVLSEDIFTIDPERIDQVKAEATFICGDKVF